MSFSQVGSRHDGRLKARFVAANAVCLIAVMTVLIAGIADAIIDSSDLGQLETLIQVVQVAGYVVAVTAFIVSSLMARQLERGQTPCHGGDPDVDRP